jgi:hypothetical protein
MAAGSIGQNNPIATAQLVKLLVQYRSSGGLLLFVNSTVDRLALKDEGPGLFSHIHGPAAGGETGPVIFAMDTNTEKTQWFELTEDQMKDLDDELCYFDIHSEMCPSGAIRGQILPLLNNADHIVKQLTQTQAEAVTEARI